VPRRTIVIAASGLVALGLGGSALGIWLWNRSETKDVRGSSTVEFVVTAEPGADPTVETTRRGRRIATTTSARVMPPASSSVRRTTSSGRRAAET
jgi:hypothetical protein